MLISSPDFLSHPFGIAVFEVSPERGGKAPSGSWSLGKAVHTGRLPETRPGGNKGTGKPIGSFMLQYVSCLQTEALQSVVHLAAFPVLPPQGPSPRALLIGKLLDLVPSAPSTVPTYTEGAQ